MWDRFQSDPLAKNVYETRSIHNYIVYGTWCHLLFEITQHYIIFLLYQAKSYYQVNKIFYIFSSPNHLSTLCFQECNL